MARKVLVARNPEQTKVTTVSASLGEKGVPFGWEYIWVERDELPTDRKLVDAWPDLAKGKRVFTSTSNKETANLRDIQHKVLASKRHIESIDTHRKEMLKDLDVEFIRTLEASGTRAKRKAIVKFKEDLRAIDVKAEDFRTEEELLEYWPAVFNYTLDDYTFEKNMKPLAVAGSVIIFLTIIIPLLIVML